MRFPDANRSPPWIASGAGFRLKTLQPRFCRGKGADITNPRVFSILSIYSIK
jgi:hypothetical protein